MTLFWPFFSFGHKMGTHFRHPYKNVNVNLGRIGPTVSIKSGDLNCGLRQPRRSDLTSFGPPFWGVPNNFYFMQLFDCRPSRPFFGHFFTFGHNVGTPLGHPHKKIDPPMSLPIEKEHHMQILVRIGPTVWPATLLQTERQRDKHSPIYIY